MSNHVKRKFVIWMSIFLSLLLTSIFSSASGFPEKTGNGTVNKVPIDYRSRQQYPSRYYAAGDAAAVQIHNQEVWNEAVWNNAVEAARQQAEAERQAALAQKQKERQSQQASSTSDAPTNGDVETALQTYFGDIYYKARAVANCESSLRADNGRNPPNYGLFQINSVHADRWKQVTGKDFWSTWMNPMLNAQVARDIYNEQGWGPWSCKWAN